MLLAAFIGLAGVEDLYALRCGRQRAIIADQVGVMVSFLGAPT